MHWDKFLLVNERMTGACISVDKETVYIPRLNEHFCRILFKISWV